MDFTDLIEHQDFYTIPDKAKSNGKAKDGAKKAEETILPKRKTPIHLKLDDPNFFGEKDAVSENPTIETLVNSSPLLQKLQERWAEKLPPCVAITASALHRNSNEFIQKGFAAFIPKPFRFEAVCECISSLEDVEFEYREPDHSSETEAEPEQKPGTGILPKALCQRLTIAAQDYEMARLEAVLDELARLGSRERALATRLRKFVGAYDMEGLLAELAPIGPDSA